MNPTVSASVNLNAADIDALARLFNFVEIGVDNGTGTIQSTLSVALIDPDTQAGTTGRITLPELLTGLGSLTSLVNGPVLTGFANLTLPVRMAVPVGGISLDLLEPLFARSRELAHLLLALRLLQCFPACLLLLGLLGLLLRDEACALW